MKEPLIATFLLLLLGISDHFPESNSIEKNSFIDYSIQTKNLEKFDLPNLYFSNLYNQKGINLDENNNNIISNMSKIIFITNASESNITPSSYIVIYKVEIFKKIMKKLEESFTLNHSIVLILNENIFNGLSRKEIFHYKLINNCFIITYSKSDPNFNINNTLANLSKTKGAINEMIIEITISFKKYSIVTYLLISSAILIFLLFIEIKYVYLYRKSNYENKLPIQRFIIYIMISLDLCFIFLMIEILMSESILIKKKIENFNFYYVTKILKVLFFNITKNLIVLFFLFISRGYSIIFFDNKYRNKYLKTILKVFALDYLFQIIFSLFGDIKLFDIIFIIDIYPIIYYIVIPIYINKIGNNIKLGLYLILYNLNNRKNLGWNQNDLNKIKEMVEYKIILRVNILYYCVGFSILGFLFHSIFQILCYFFKGNTIYDLIIILQLVVGIFFIQRLFIPKKLIEKYKMKFEELINGVPSEYLNVFVFKNSDKDYLTQEDVEFIKINNSPIMILNSFKKTGQIDKKNLLKGFLNRGGVGFIRKED